MAAAVGTAMTDVKEAIGVQTQFNVDGGVVVTGPNNNIVVNNCMPQRPDETVLGKSYILKFSV